MGFTYRTMLESAKKEGKTSEKTMWESVDAVSEMLKTMEAEHPELYWKFMRDQYGIINNRHYGKEFAEYDTSYLSYTDKQGVKHYGPHWTLEQVSATTSNLPFKPNVTAWDKYVAFNATYADFCKNFTDEQILRIAHDFFFCDEDWGTDTKVWDYFCCRER